MRLPTAAEINPDGDDSQDGEWAAENFLGKSLREAETLFTDAEDRYLYDLVHMGSIAFCFYFPAVIRRFRVEVQYGYPVSSFYWIVADRLRRDREGIKAALPALRESVQYILDHWDKWRDADVSRPYSGGFYRDIAKSNWVRLLEELAA